MKWTRYFATPEGRPRLWIPIAVGIALAAMTALAFGLQTNEVELGRESNYDGTVRIERDAQGRMTFADAEITSPVSLSALTGGAAAHGELQGLTADDHPQYLNAARHGTEHGPAFNSALPTDADVNGNATLGGHAADAQIHLNRTQAETVSGNWIFTGAPEFRSDLYLSNGGAAGDQLIRFEDGAQDASLLWNFLAGRFEFDRGLSLGGTLGIGTTVPSASLDVDPFNAGWPKAPGADAAVTDAEGLAALNLLGASADGAAVYFGDATDADAGAVIYDNAFDAMSFRAAGAERLRLDSAGRLGVGTSTPVRRFQVSGSAADFYLQDADHPDNTGTGGTFMRSDEGTLSMQGMRGSDGVGSAVFFRIVHVNPSAPRVAIGSQTPDHTLDVAGTLQLEDGAAPGTPVGGAVFYSVGGEMKVKDAAGNETPLSSHNFEGFAPRPDDPLPFSIHSKNVYLGRAMWIDLTGLARFLERQFPGERFIYYRDLPPEEIEDPADSAAARPLPDWLKARLEAKRTQPTQR